jgi:DNA-directed RNA polymerase specialized sigma24 family protein
MPDEDLLAEEDAAPLSDDFAPPAEEPAPDDGPRISPSDVRTYVLQKETQKAILKRIKRRVHRDQAEDLVQLVLIAATGEPSRPRAIENLEAWTNGIADKVIARFYDRKTKRATAEREFVMKFETTSAPPSGVKEEKLMARWLFLAMKELPHDSETLDIIRDHVVNGRTFAEIAALRGMDVRSVENRVAHFKVKYAHHRKHYIRYVTQLAIFSVLLVSAIAYALYRLVVSHEAEFKGSIAPPHAMTAPAPPPPAPTASAFPQSVEPVRPAPSVTPPPRGDKGPAR